MIPRTPGTTISSMQRHEDFHLYTAEQMQKEYRSGWWSGFAFGVVLPAFVVLSVFFIMWGPF